jgi:dCTP deaminase
MILSDVSIKKALAEGRVIIDPLGANAIQPSSVDVHVDRYFRVFRNDTTPFIDPKEPQEDLTELVEIPDDRAFILHPGEFVLGSTLERVALPDDLVGRLEGKSSLGRLGLLIHSSLPADEPVLVRYEGATRLLPIGDIVGKKLDVEVVAFDKDTFRTSYVQVTGWYEGPEDRIYEVKLASGRSVRVTAGHNLFTINSEGDLVGVRTGALSAGTLVAVPRRIPAGDCTPFLDLRGLIPENEDDRLVVEGPSIRRAFEAAPAMVGGALIGAGVAKTAGYYGGKGCMPWRAARLVPGLVESLTAEDRVRVKGGRNAVPAVMAVTADLAWLLGLYVAEGYRRPNQVTISSTDLRTLDRAQQVLFDLGLPVYRAEGRQIVCCSGILARLIGWLGIGDYAWNKRIPEMVLGWPLPLVEAFFDGMMQGDGSREYTRDSYWTSSQALVGDVMLLMARCGRRASASFRMRAKHGLFQVSIPHGEHKLMTAVPATNRLLVRLREELDLSQQEAAHRAGFKHRTSLNNIEKCYDRDGIRRVTLATLLEVFRAAPSAGALERLVDGDLVWDRVVEVRDTGRVEPIFDLEVHPSGSHYQNFVAGSGGVCVSNTAGFVDAGFEGHLTLELSNVANLPIAIYPGMKIGQISFMQMTSPAEHPYGSKETGSKYKGQRGPTPSRYYLNFEPEERAD